jgi:hypothetical protein
MKTPSTDEWLGMLFLGGIAYIVIRLGFAALF